MYVYNVRRKKKMPELKSVEDKKKGIVNGREHSTQIGTQRGYTRYKLFVIES